MPTHSNIQSSHWINAKVNFCFSFVRNKTKIFTSSPQQKKKEADEKWKLSSIVSFTLSECQRDNNSSTFVNLALFFRHIFLYLGNRKNCPKNGNCALIMKMSAKKSVSLVNQENESICCMSFASLSECCPDLMTRESCCWTYKGSNQSTLLTRHSKNSFGRSVHVR